MIVTDPEDSDDDSKTVIIAEDNKSFKKLTKVNKDDEKVTPVLNYLLVEGSIPPSEHDLFSDALAKRKLEEFQSRFFQVI